VFFVEILLDVGGECFFSEFIIVRFTLKPGEVWGCALELTFLFLEHAKRVK
jgi:hypothetical protein